MYSFAAQSPPARYRSGGRGRILKTHVTDTQVVILVDVLFKDEDEMFPGHELDIGRYAPAVHYDTDGNFIHEQEGQCIITWDELSFTPDWEPIETKAVPTIMLLDPSKPYCKLTPEAIGLPNEIAIEGAVHDERLISAGGNNEFAWALTTANLYTVDTFAMPAVGGGTPHEVHSLPIDLKRTKCPEFCVDKEYGNIVIACSMDGTLTCTLNGTDVQPSRLGHKSLCACFIQSSVLYLVYKLQDNTTVIDKYSIEGSSATYASTVLTTGFSVGMTKVAKIAGIAYCTTMVYSNNGTNSIRSTTYYMGTDIALNSDYISFSGYDIPGLLYGNVVTNKHACTLYMSDGMFMSGIKDDNFVAAKEPDISGLYTSVLTHTVKCARPTITIRLQGTTKGMSLHLRINTYTDEECTTLIDSKNTIDNIADFTLDGGRFPTNGISGDNIDYLVNVKVHVGPVRKVYAKVDFC